MPRNGHYFEGSFMDGHGLQNRTKSSEIRQLTVGGTRFGTQCKVGWNDE